MAIILPFRALAPKTQIKPNMLGETIHWVRPDAQPQPGDYVGYQQKVKMGGTVVRMTYQEPRSHEDKTPVIFVAGLCGVEQVYRALANHVRMLGRTAVTYKSPRDTVKFSPDRLLHILHPASLQEEGLGAVVRSIERVTGHKKVDLVCHSYGTPIGTEFAVHNPQKVRSLLSIGGAGTTGENSAWSMALKGLGVLSKEIIPNYKSLVQNGNGYQIALETGLHIASNLPLVISESYYAATADLGNDFSMLHDSGVPLGMIAYERDGFFLPKDIVENTAQYFNYFKVVPNAIHLHPQLEPVTHALDVVHALRDLNAPDSIAA